MKDGYHTDNIIKIKKRILFMESSSGDYSKDNLGFNFSPSSNDSNLDERPIDNKREGYKEKDEQEKYK